MVYTIGQTLTLALVFVEMIMNFVFHNEHCILGRVTNHVRSNVSIFVLSYCSTIDVLSLRRGRNF